jgi:hypothetical protein
MANAALQKNVKEYPKRTELLLVLICALALPLSMIMWIGNLAFTFFTGGASAVHHEGKNVFSLFFFVVQFFGVSAVSLLQLRFRIHIKKLKFFTANYYIETVQ